MSFAPHVDRLRSNASLKATASAIHKDVVRLKARATARAESYAEEHGGCSSSVQERADWAQVESLRKIARLIEGKL